MDEDQFASRFNRSFGVNYGVDGKTIPLVKVSYGLGALIRSGPSMNSPPIARASFDTKLVFLGQSSRSAWMRVLVHSENGGMVEAFIGKKLVEALTNDADASAFYERYPIPDTKW